jgi:alkaline phosphatase
MHRVPRRVGAHGAVTAWLGVSILTLAAPAVAEGRDEDPWFRAGRAAVEGTRARIGPSGRARNAILFLGDGMGVSTVTAARIFAGQQAGGLGEDHQLSFEALPHVGLVKTYNTNQQVPDSAGTMTAIVSGVKTKAGVLGVGDAVVTGDHKSVAAARVPTLFEEAERAGRATGIVTTARLTHATPAACYGHSAHRDWESDADLSAAARGDGFPDLARQFVEFAAGDGIDVAFGGGRARFLPDHGLDPEDPEETGTRWDERDLMSEWQAAAPGRKTLWNLEQFRKIDPEETGQVLGLFAPSHMSFEVDRAGDRAGEPSLSEMTATALAILERQPGGYLLLVEGGRIDHAHHANNAYRALAETVEFARAVELALRETRREDTLIVVTADHGHPLSMAGYVTRGNPILGHARENRSDGSQAPALDGAGRPYTTLSYTLGPGNPGKTPLQPEGPKSFPHYHPTGALPFGPALRPDLSEVDTKDPGYLQETMLPLYAGTHSGEDVAVYADGPGAALFHGVQEQSYLYHAMVEAMGLRSDE